jgi:hypothetical protein
MRQNGRELSHDVQEAGRRKTHGNRNYLCHYMMYSLASEDRLILVSRDYTMRRAVI